MLSQYLAKRKTWFALAQVKDPIYRAFYLNQPDDVRLILDNGAYEGKLDLKTYMDDICYYEPSVAVLPDIYLGDADRSLHLGLGFLEQCEQDGRSFSNEWMFVPQGQPGDIDGFVRCAFEALKDPRVTWIGIPRCLSTDISDNPLARVLFAGSIKKDYPHINLHALGMVKGNVHELYYLQKIGVRSCDSTAPVWRGLHGKMLFQPWEELAFRFDAEPPLGRYAVCHESNLLEIDTCLITP